MRIQHLNEKFNLYESSGHKVEKGTIRDALNATVKGLIDKRISNIKPYEVALIDEIKSQFAVKNHMNVVDCDIFKELNTSKNPYKVVDIIVKSIKPEWILDNALNSEIPQGQEEE